MRPFAFHPLRPQARVVGRIRSGLPTSRRKALVEPSATVGMFPGPAVGYRGIEAAWPMAMKIEPGFGRIELVAGLAIVAAAAITGAGMRAADTAPAPQPQPRDRPGVNRPLTPPPGPNNSVAPGTRLGGLTNPPGFNTNAPGWTNRMGTNWPGSTNLWGTNAPGRTNQLGTNRVGLPATEGLQSPGSLTLPGERSQGLDDGSLLRPSPGPDNPLPTNPPPPPPQSQPNR